MEYLSVKNAADSIGISTRRIQQMCQKVEIKGAVKKIEHGESLVVSF